jgi:dolichol-phosphate mannosyltransferase
MRTLDQQTTLSIVIPCHNEASVLPLLFSRLNTVAQHWPMRLEVIVVDDGSSDESWSLLNDFHAVDPRWKAIRLARNFGHQLALWAGLRHAHGDLVAILDADLQDPPEVLATFFPRWSEGYDVVYGVRTRRKESLWKRLAYFGFYRLVAALSEIAIPVDAGDFCLMDRRVAAAILRSREAEPYLRGIRAWVGFRQIGVAYERQARAAGDAKYTWRKLLRLATSGIFSCSTRPLRLATHLGFAISLLSFLASGFTLLQRVFADQFARIGLRPVPGFATIVIAVFFLGGVQLICLGILGEYVGRIYENVKGRPRFVADKRLGLRRPRSTVRRSPDLYQGSSP